MKSILEFGRMREQGVKISMITCYDAWSAKIIQSTPIDCILIGDSCAMVMHGQPSTVFMEVETMALHTRAVARGAPGKFLIGDVPFLAHRKGLKPLMDAVEQLMKAGAHAVKVEGAAGHLSHIAHVVESGVPVMGHLGLTPQSVNQLGGFKVQGKGEEAARRMMDDALSLERAGCFALVLECIPAPLAGEITRLLTIPTIGIGSGPDTSGQVLVLHDLLGMDPSFKPKFVRRYLDGYTQMRNALEHYHLDVKAGAFPVKEESFV